MASFSITANGTTAGKVLGDPATAILIAGVGAPSTVRVEASADGTIYAPVTQQMQSPGVTPISIPAGWSVRVVTIAGVGTLAIRVEVA